MSSSEERGSIVCLCDQGETHIHGGQVLRSEVGKIVQILTQRLQTSDLRKANVSIHISGRKNSISGEQEKPCVLFCLSAE